MTSSCILTAGSIIVNFITDKLIKCIDENSHPEYATIFEKMEESSTYSPIDDTKDKYVKYSFDEFISALNNRRWSFFSPTGIKYTISQYSDNKANIYVDRYEYEHSMEYKNFVDSRFTVTKELMNSGWGYTPRCKMELIGVEELYQKAEPCYRIKYLQNNKEYRKECFYE